MITCCISIPTWISLVLVLFATTLNLASFSAPSWATGFNTSELSSQRKARATYQEKEAEVDEQVPTSFGYCQLPTHLCIAKLTSNRGLQHVLRIPSRGKKLF